MLPVIALAGRPNVGKSSLFNCLTQSRLAIVSDVPHVTRDRLYGKGLFEDKAYLVIDTAGLSFEKNASPIDTLAAEQTAEALKEADHILFIVDAKAGLLPLDKTLAKKIRTLSKPVTLVINKVDPPNDPFYDASEFLTLGFKDYLTVSSAHQKNIIDLLSLCLRTTPPPVISGAEENGIKIALLGKPNAGKSTLANQMIGQKKRLIVSPVPGTTRDSIYLPFRRENKNYVLIDTAGLRKKNRISAHLEKISAIKTFQAIEAADVVMLLIDAQTCLTDQDLQLAAYGREAGKVLIFVINKWDGLSRSQRYHFKKDITHQLAFMDFSPVHYISALHGTGVGELFKSIQTSYACFLKTWPAAQLTRLLEKAVENHAPPAIAGRRIKLRYAHSGGQKPPRIIIHGNQTQKLPASYTRYLVSFFRKHLKLTGTPLWLNFKENINPYKPQD